MKVIRFSMEAKYRIPTIWFPSEWFEKSIEYSLRKKYSKVECIKKNLEYKKHNENVWSKIKQLSIKNLYREEQLIASYDKRRIHYFIFSNDLRRQYKKETSFEVLIISQKNRNIDLVINQVISHIKRKMWFMNIDIIKDGGINIYFEKKIDDNNQLKNISADIVENDKPTLVEKISTFGLFMVGIILTYIALHSKESDFKTIVLSIGTSELAVIVGVVLTHIAKMWNRSVKISIIDVGSFVEDENIMSDNISPFELDEYKDEDLVNPNEGGNDENTYENEDLVDSNEGGNDENTYENEDLVNPNEGEGLLNSILN